MALRNCDLLARMKKATLSVAFFMRIEDDAAKGVVSVPGLKPV